MKKNRSSSAVAPSIQPRALKLEAARAYLGGLSKVTMWRLIRKGLLRPNRSIRHLLFDIEELNRFIAGN